MKNIFAMISLAAISLSANAQEVGTFDTSALGLSGTAIEVAAGTKLAETNSITCVTAYTDNAKKVSSANGTADKYDTAIEFDGVRLSLNDGIQGSTNPTALGAITDFPDKGWINEFKVGAISSWGELYVAAKFTGSKKYWVIEETSSGVKTIIPYWLVFDAQADGYNNGIQYVTPFDLGVDESTWSLSDFDAINQTPDAICQNADDPHLAETVTFTKGKNGAGVIFFDVLPNRNYYVFATGSKITSSGYYYKDGGACKNISVIRTNKETGEEVGSYPLLKESIINKGAE